MASDGPVRKPSLMPVIAHDFDQPLTIKVRSEPPVSAYGET